MKRFKIIVLVLIILGVVAGYQIYACKEHSESKCKGKREWMKDVLPQDAKIEFSEIENGVLVKITSDKPEGVKKIHELLPMNVEITEIPNGAAVKVTSAKPDAIKRIQEHIREHQEQHKSGFTTAWRVSPPLKSGVGVYPSLRSTNFY